MRQTQTWALRLMESRSVPGGRARCARRTKRFGSQAIGHWRFILIQTLLFWFVEKGSEFLVGFLQFRRLRWFLRPGRSRCRFIGVC
jgi:hypothetical protein